MNALQGQITNLGMTLETAQNYVARIQYHLEQADHHITEARSLILELYELEGWKVLGFDSWRACVQKQFKKSSSTVYRQLNAALVELELSPSGGIGLYNERVLRPLTKKNYAPESRRLVIDISQQIVGEGGKVTSGVVEAVIDGLTDMLGSGAMQLPDGDQHPIGQVMSADLIARVREKKIAHKQHIQRMDKKRTYLAGGVETVIQSIKPHGRTVVELTCLNELQIAALQEAQRLNKQVYASLWFED